MSVFPDFRQNSEDEFSTVNASDNIEFGNIISRNNIMKVDKFIKDILFINVNRTGGMTSQTENIGFAFSPIQLVSISKSRAI